MTTTETDAPTVQAVAEANARWVTGKLEDGDAEALQFLRYRPARELEDVQDAAKRGRAADTVAVLDDALRLSRGHTGGPSTCPTGYDPIVYPVTEDERARLLQSAVDATRMMRLPGADRGWTWGTSVDVDPEKLEVTIVLRARHPRVAGTPAD